MITAAAITRTSFTERLRSLKNRKKCLYSVLLISFLFITSKVGLIHDTDNNFYSTTNMMMSGGSSRESGISIFYNAYVPLTNNTSSTDSAFNIIKEQMKQVSDSAAAADRSKMTLRYVTIGEPSNVVYIEELCHQFRMNCVHVNHYEAGYEMLTQQALLDFCKIEGSDMEIVSYIHNKGSLNPSEGQNKGRRTMTDATLSQDCMERLSDNVCNVCGPTFKSVWGPTYWGNFWSARCDYVKNLVSPFDLHAKNKEAFDSKPEGMTADFYGTSGSMIYSLGEGRYAAEQFVANHPSLIPCSFTHPSWEPNMIWEVDPRGNFYDLHVIHTERALTKEEMNTHDKFKEWFLLPGILWRYHKIYGEMPPPDSWVWRHYPDGETWKAVIEEVGFPEALLQQLID